MKKQKREIPAVSIAGTIQCPRCRCLLTVEQRTLVRMALRNKRDDAKCGIRCETAGLKFKSDPSLRLGKRRKAAN